MLDVKLSARDTQDLKNALDRHVHELMAELVHTDDRALHAALKRDVERVEALRKRFEWIVEQAEASPTG
jgi:hypothetical protein